MSPLIKYFRDTAAELKQVSWPTQHQALMYTILVIIISTFVAFFTGAFDFFFSRLIERVIGIF